MRDKDAAFNNLIAEASSRLSLDNSRDEFIEPTEIEHILSEFDQIKADAEKRSKKILFKLGLVNRELKKNTMEFLDFYNTFRQNASDHNSELALRRSRIIGERINPVEGRDLDTQQLSSIAMDVRTRLVIAGAGTGKTLYLVAVNHKESIFFREIISNHSVLGEPAPYKRACPKCGGEMVLRKGRFGEFYGCSNFLSKGCRYTMKK